MKKIILFTRIVDEEEWNAWRELLQQKGVNVQGNTIEYTIGDVQLVVKNGKAILGTLPPRGGNGAEAEKFIKNLWEQIQQEKEAIIGIHFGSGQSLDDRLIYWCKQLQQNQNIEGILSFVNSGRLLAYSTGAGSKDQIKGWINSVTDNLENLEKLGIYLKKEYSFYISKIRHLILNIFSPIDTDLSGLKDSNFNENYLEKVMKAWKNKAGKKIEVARKKIYKDKKDKNEICLEDIIEMAELTQSDQWENLKKLLPKDEPQQSNNYNEYIQMKEVLEALDRSDENKVKSNAEAFCKWFKSLVEQIDGIREQLTYS